MKNVFQQPVKPIAPSLLRWYSQHGRHALPWRQTRDPYAIWLAEIMLQQTQVATVLPYYQRFLTQFPDIHSLAAADLDAVLHLWTGLGYYARARHLHACAQRIVAEHQGHFPQDLAQMLQLPGIGRSTAGAILSSAFEQAQPILDGNVRRILLRYYGLDADPTRTDTQQQLWCWAEQQTPQAQTHSYNQAIQDLGATLCRPRQPQCGLCPIQAGCQAHRLGQSNTLPRPRRRAPMPIRSAWMALIQNASGQILLQRQALKGLWGGLWSLPLLAQAEPRDIAEAFSKQLGFTQHMLQPGPVWPSTRHSFTHFHLDYTPVELHSTVSHDTGDEQLTWVKPSDPGQRGLSAPTQQILQQLAQRHFI